jgi:hypothetical protein
MGGVIVKYRLCDRSIYAPSGTVCNCFDEGTRWRGPAGEQLCGMNAGRTVLAQLIGHLPTRNFKKAWAATARAFLLGSVSGHGLCAVDLP